MTPFDLKEKSSTNVVVKLNKVAASRKATLAKCRAAIYPEGPVRVVLLVWELAWRAKECLSNALHVFLNDLRQEHASRGQPDR